jgi:hypothetical protein
MHSCLLAIDDPGADMLAAVCIWQPAHTYTHQDVNSAGQPCKSNTRLLLLLLPLLPTPPFLVTGIVQECILARDAMSGSTCPIRSGFIFMGHYSAANTTTCSSSSEVGLPAPAGEDAARAEAAGAAANADVKAAAAGLGSLAYQPWVAAAHDLTTAKAVHMASFSGLLPPMLEYASNGTTEYIEFAVPSQQQLAQQQQEWAALCSGAAGVSSSSSSGGVQGTAGTLPAGGFLAPVLWFR